MKKYTFIIICILLFSNVASADTTSFIGKIKDIRIIQKESGSNLFEVSVSIFGVISGKADSVFYIHSPAKQLRISNYENPETFDNRIFLFYLSLNNEQITFIKADDPAYLYGECKICKTPLQGFCFGNKRYSHCLYYCPRHGEMDEVWEEYKE
jgi:hypothetical protein